ncbi:unnamed protein product [Gulo gulo]|uniref:Uncharacterized protein n=1 Tax=Gulo gulo TaxID=48420 RepID=A0A9X9LE08_GULGU|nr:unnamed protein product [Gulo gulo]
MPSGATSSLRSSGSPETVLAHEEWDLKLATNGLGDKTHRQGAP